MFKRFVLCAAVVASLGGAARAEKLVCIAAHVVEAGPEAFAEHVAPRLAGKSDAPLSPAEGERLAQALSAHPDCSVTAAPKAVVQPGRECRVHAGRTQRFATGVTVRVVNGQPRLEPVVESVDLGTTVRLLPTPCRGGVRVQTELRHLSVRTNTIHVVQVTEFAHPASPDKPTPMGQSILAPTIDRVALERTFDIRPNGWVIADAGEVTVEDCSGELCAFVAKHPETERLARALWPSSFDRTKKARCVLLLSAGATEATPVVGK